MTARTITETTLIAYHLGDLDAATRADVEARLAESPDLRAELAAIRAFHGELRHALTASLPEAMPPERVWNALAPNLPRPGRLEVPGDIGQALPSGRWTLIRQAASRVIAAIRLMLGSLRDGGYSPRGEAVANATRLLVLAAATLGVLIALWKPILLHDGSIGSIPPEATPQPGVSSAACAVTSAGGSIQPENNNCSVRTLPPLYTPAPTQPPNSVELLAGPWSLKGHGGEAQASQTIAPTTLNGRDTLQITYDLHGLQALGGDASAIGFDQGGWRVVSLSDYGQNGLDGQQVVHISLSDFHGLDPAKPVSQIQARFWYSRPFTVDITSIVVYTAQENDLTPIPEPVAFGPDTTPSPTGAATPASRQTGITASPTPATEPRPAGLTMPGSTTATPSAASAAMPPTTTDAPAITQVGAAPTPTSSPEPVPTALAAGPSTAIATATPTAAPASSAPPTPTPAQTPLCQPTPAHALDVVLLLDRSGSMRAELELAQEAAGGLVTSLPPDAQVGLVTFAARPSLDAHLGADASDVERAIDTIKTGGGTNLAAGIALAQSELEGARRRPASIPVMIILSDGNDQALRATTRAAMEAKRHGIYVVTVGIGAHVEEGILRRLASSEDSYAALPTDADLTALEGLLSRLRQCGD